MRRWQQYKRNLGSDNYLTIIHNDTEEVDLIFKILWSKIHLFDQRFSRFKISSELTKVNLHAGSKTKISQDFYNFLNKSIKMSYLSEGLFNPLILPDLQSAGYIGSWPTPHLYKSELDFRLRNKSDVSEINLTSNEVTLPKNSALDSGGIGKGYLLDQLATWMDSQGIANYWFALGGDIICRGFNLEKVPWRIAIASANNSTHADLIENNNGELMAVATSGITKRNGPNWHHLIDPRTNKPAKTNILMATVLSNTATLADLYAKCIVILGQSDAKVFMTKHDIKKMYLQLNNSKKLQTLVG